MTIRDLTTLMGLALVSAAIAAYAGPFGGDEGPTAGQGEGAEVISQHDKDGDGALSEEEAQGTEYERQFGSLDRNGDGKLESHEIARGGSGMRQQSPTEAE